MEWRTRYDEVRGCSEGRLSARVTEASAAMAVSMDRSEGNPNASIRRICRKTNKLFLTESRSCNDLQKPDIEVLL